MTKYVHKAFTTMPRVFPEMYNRATPQQAYRNSLILLPGYTLVSGKKENTIT